MNKKIVVLLLAAVIVGCVQLAQAQQPKKVPRIGFLSPLSSAAASLNLEAFRNSLRELGHVEGKTIVIESRFADGKLDRLSELATELVRLKVDVIVAGSLPGILAAKNATSSIPIVFVSGGDPVVAGIVASLARPGGNITGLSLQRDDLGAKRLELLKEAFPKIIRTAFLFAPNDVSDLSIVKAIQDVVPTLGVTLQLVEVRNAGEFDSAFAAISRGRIDALLSSESPLFNTHRNRNRIVEFAATRRLPVMYGFREFVEAGGIMSYGASLSDAYGRAAAYVDKILKGAKPADLPVQQPTKFELIINLKTAKQIGLTIPPNVLARADKVIR
jgi:putative tryptophan/tyrosine transport system substrate-binding protein